MLKRLPALVVLVALPLMPAAAAAEDHAPRQSSASERREQERERERERAERERERKQQQAERAREQAERDRERKQEQAERAREQAERERERKQEQAERQREHAARHRDGRWVVVEGERTSQTFKVGETGSLRVDNLAGDITVTGTTGGDIQVETVKYARGATDSEARQRFRDVDVSYQKVGGRVEIETSHRPNARAWVAYTIAVPAGTAVDLKSVSGDVRVSNVRGEVRAESVSGDIEAMSLPKVASLKSISGDVAATSVGSDTELALSSVSGDVVAKALKARSATVGTVSGSAQLKGCACAQASVQSVSGGVEYTGRLEKTGRYEFKTHSGDVLVASGGEGFNLDASTFSGSLRSDVPLVTRGGDANFERGRGPGRWVKAVSGSGGAYVEIKTFSGDIILTRAQ
jgi:DUF4097 and DUF4098 domain-containing protein YvlB